VTKCGSALKAAGWAGLTIFRQKPRAFSTNLDRAVVAGDPARAGTETKPTGAWLLARKPWIVPIPGTTKRHRLEENLGAVAVEPTPDDLREIDSAASRITVQAARYPEHLERMTGR
jgi:aryl-alcohol dehydrogenase-like predicted oxidoreductase